MQKCECGNIKEGAATKLWREKFTFKSAPNKWMFKHPNPFPSPDVYMHIHYMRTVWVTMPFTIHVNVLYICTSRHIYLHISHEFIPHEESKIHPNQTTCLLDIQVKSSWMQLILSKNWQIHYWGAVSLDMEKVLVQYSITHQQV